MRVIAVTLPPRVPTGKFNQADQRGFNLWVSGRFMTASSPAKEKPQEGEVVAVGAGAKTEEGKITPLDVKAGDKILFGKWSGTEVKIDGEDLIIMKESDILGIVG